MHRRLFLVVLFISIISVTSISCAKEGHNHQHDAKGAEKITEDLGMCPVMGGAANKDNSYTHDGKTYYFCCPWCIEEFKKNPKAYISDKQ